MLQATQERIKPLDVHNSALLGHAYPDDWTNPRADGRYNLVVIGGGPAGLVTAAAAAGLGARVALVEKHLMGGDCLNVGCVPSKCLIRSSRAARDVVDGAEFGVRVSDRVEVDFAAVMERMRRIRSEISHEDSVRRYTDLGVDIFLGAARFSGSETVEVGDQTLRFKKAVVTTGARAVEPKIDGLKEAGYLTNETVFWLTERPARLACIGGGPIGCELAQAFSRLGSKVHLFHRGDHILNREDSDAAEIVQRAFLREGIELVLDARLERVEVIDGAKVIHYTSDGKPGRVEVDDIFAGAGRAPNVESLNLESIGVDYDTRQGIKVDDRLRTTNPSIFAAGDVCMQWKFTHAADAAARIVIQNSLFGGRKKLSDLVMPWCTYTDPEIAHVGLYERDARAKGIEVETFFQPFSDVHRALADGEEDGFVKVHVKKGTDKILGATIVARHAGEMINELSLAIVAGLGLGTIASVIHSYPTQAEAIKKIGDAYNRTRLTPFVKKLFTKWLAWTR